VIGALVLKEMEILELCSLLLIVIAVVGSRQLYQST